MLARFFPLRYPDASFNSFIPMRVPSHLISKTCDYMHLFEIATSSFRRKRVHCWVESAHTSILELEPNALYLVGKQAPSNIVHGEK